MAENQKHRTQNVPSSSSSTEASSKKRMGQSAPSSSGGGSGTSHGNKMMRNIVSDQPRIQIKHHHEESFWEKVGSEMNGDDAEVDFQHQDIPFAGVARLMNVGRGRTKGAIPSGESAMIMTRALELLVMEMTVKACVQSDVLEVIQSTDEYDIFTLITSTS